MIGHAARPGRTYLTEPPERTQIDLVSGFESEGNLSKLGVALWILTPDGPSQKQEPRLTEDGLSRTYELRLKSGRPVRFQTIAAMVSELYHPEPPLEAIRLASWGNQLGFETLRGYNRAAWMGLWKCRVKAIGEADATRDVALGFWEYQLATNDQDFLHVGTWPILKAVAEWIESRGVFTGRGVEIQHIMGPDEGVPNINNVSYMNLVCKMVLTSAIRCAQMAGAHAPGSWSKIRDAFVLPVDNTNRIVQPYDNPPPPSSKSYSMAQLDFLAVHDIPIDKELLRRTHAFEESISLSKPIAPLMAESNFTIGFAEAAVSATAPFLGDKHRAFELFRRAWRTSWLEPFGMIRETPFQDYGCFLTDYGSLLQTAMFGFTGLRISEGDWQKYPASLPEGWSRIEVDRIFVKGEEKKLIATDGAPAQLVSA